MVDDLLDVVSIESGRLALNLSDHDLTDVLREASESMLPLAGRKKISLVFRQPAERFAVRCDHGRVLQVLSNLVGNAIHFTPRGGVVTVSVETSARRAVVTVDDTGVGIPRALIPRLGKGLRGGGDIGRVGRGFGLYIAKGLVEAQGGIIWAERRPIGSSFHFTLPAAADGPAPSAEDRPRSGRARPTGRSR